MTKNNFLDVFLRKFLKKIEKEDNRRNVDKSNHAVQTYEQFESEGKIHLILLTYQGEKGLHF